MSIYSWLLSRFRMLRGFLARVLWLRTYYLKLLLTVLSAVMVFAFFSINEGGWYSMAVNIQNYGYLTEAIAVLILAFSLIKGWSIAHTDVTFEKLEPITWIANETGAYNSCVPFGKHAIVFNTDVNLSLELGMNPLRMISGKFKLHPLIYQLLPVFIMKMPEAGLDTSDDEKVRLASDLDPDVIRSGTTLNLQRTSYFRDRLSNTLANYLVKMEGRVILDLRNTEVRTREGYFYSLRESALSNQLGGSVILFTSDSTIIILSQGNRTAENAGRLAPAGSGSFDTLPRKKLEALTFQEYARKEVARELREECGLSEQDVHNIQICGFGRYLYRNGKPEVFCVATTRKTSNEIRIPVREWDYQQKKVKILPFWGTLSRESALTGIAQLISNIELKADGYENSSAPLYWNALFAKQYLEVLEVEDEARLFQL
jgi:hypothetical protein